MTLAVKITLIRIGLTPILVLSMLMCSTVIHNIINTLLFLFIALTDYLDGYFARSRNEVTNQGKFLDPLADKILVISAMLVLVEMGKLSSIPVIIVIVRELMVMGLRSLAALKGTVIEADKWGKAKTVVQVTAVIWVMLDAYFSSIIVLGMVGLTIWSGLNYFVTHRNVFND